MVEAKLATTEITVSEPGKAIIQVHDPRPLRPSAQKRRNYETQAFDGFTFKCYGKDVMARADGGPTVCPEEP